MAPPPPPPKRGCGVHVPTISLRVLRQAPVPVERKERKKERRNGGMVGYRHGRTHGWWGKWSLSVNGTYFHPAFHSHYFVELAGCKPRLTASPRRSRSVIVSAYPTSLSLSLSLSDTLPAIQSHFLKFTVGLVSLSLSHTHTSIHICVSFTFVCVCA